MNSHLLDINFRSGNQYLCFNYNFYVYVLASNVPGLICLSQPIISVQWKLCNENYQAIPGFANSSRKCPEVSTAEYMLCLLFKIQQFILLYGVYYMISTNKQVFYPYWLENLVVLFMNFV